MVKFSCADFTFPVLDRPAALRLVKLLGFDHVDIGLFARSTHFSPDDLERSPQSYTRQVLDELSSAELCVSDLFLQTGITPDDLAANDPSHAVTSRNRDIFKRALEFCVALGSRHLTGLPGVLHPGVAQERDLGLAAEVAAWRLAECASAGVCYAIEPHVGSIASEVGTARALLDAVEGLTLTLDYGHFVMAGESSEEIHSLVPFASHVHARGGAPERLQVSVSENTIDFSGMLNELRRSNYGHFIALEYVWVDWKDCNRTDNISETVLLRRTLESTIRDLENGS